MKISTKGLYALRMLVDLAINQQDGYVSLKDVSQRQKLSKKYMEQIMNLLNKSDILETGRGANGGYRLAKKAQDIKIGEILRLTEGSLAVVSCLETDENNCTIAVDCPTLPMWMGLNKIIYSYLDSVTLLDLVNQSLLVDKETLEKFKEENYD